MVQWLRLCTSPAGNTGLIPDWGSSTFQVVWGKKNPGLPGQNMARAAVCFVKIMLLLKQELTVYFPGNTL